MNINKNNIANYINVYTLPILFLIVVVEKFVVYITAIKKLVKRMP